MGHLTQRTNKNITSEEFGRVENYRPGYKLQITKKLNPFAYLIIGSLYTIAVVVTTLNYAKKEERHIPNRGYSYSEEKIRDDILREVRNISKTNAKIRVDNKISSELVRFRDEMMAEVNRVNIKYLEIIENSESLKDSALAGLVAREPASEKIKKGKPIVFNESNARLLRYVHQKEYKRAKGNFEFKKNELIKRLDLSKRSDQEKLREFTDQMDLALFELKQTHRAQREEFKRKRYIVVKN